jgi:hypothetical protein
MYQEVRIKMPKGFTRVDLENFDSEGIIFGMANLGVSCDIVTNDGCTNIELKCESPGPFPDGARQYLNSLRWRGTRLEINYR